MKRIQYLAAGTLGAALIGVAVGASFYISGTRAERPVKTYDDYMLRAEQLFKDGDHYKALVSYQSALEKKSDSIEARKGLAAVYYNEMNYEKEYEIRQEIEELDPQDFDNELRLVELLINEKKYDEAKKKTEDLLAENDSEALRSLYNEMSIPDPQFNISSGSYDDYQLLDVVNNYENAVVHYTLDGSLPDEESPVCIDGIVVAYPENHIRAVAIGALGFRSNPVTLDISITKPEETVGYADYNSGTLDIIGRGILNKSYMDPIYNYELAQIREVYILGENYADKEPIDVAFYEDSYSVSGYRYSEPGKMNLSFVEYTPFLKKMCICWQEGLDLEPLRNMTGLEELSLLNDGITDISPLSGLTSLKRLSLGWNQITSAAPLSDLAGLESLGLWNNQISDISALSGLTNLTYLDVSYNELSSISAVSGMEKLNELWIRNNHITDLSPLKNCERIVILMQKNNPIGDYSVLYDLSDQIYKSDVNWGNVK